MSRKWPRVSGPYFTNRADEIRALVLATSTCPCGRCFFLGMLQPDASICSQRFDEETAMLTRSRFERFLTWLS